MMPGPGQYTINYTDIQNDVRKKGLVNVSVRKAIAEKIKKTNKSKKNKQSVNF